MKVKKLVIGIAIVLAVVALPAELAAQVDPAVKANIPFAFRAGDTPLPAGTYRISYVPRLGNMLRIEHKNNAVMLPAGSLEPRANAVTKLVFRRYGSIYFLAQAWMADRSCELPKSDSEREYAARFPTETVAVMVEK